MSSIIPRQPSRTSLGSSTKNIQVTNAITPSCVGDYEVPSLFLPKLPSDINHRATAIYLKQAQQTLMLLERIPFTLASYSIVEEIHIGLLHLLACDSANFQDIQDALEFYYDCVGEWRLSGIIKAIGDSKDLDDVWALVVKVEHYDSHGAGGAWWHNWWNDIVDALGVQADINKVISATMRGVPTIEAKRYIKQLRAKCQNYEAAYE